MAASALRIGTIFPQTELGGDVGAVRAYGEKVNELGFTHIGVYDHVLGADPEIHKPWMGPYDVNTTFHEPFVLFGFLAAVADVELVSEVFILPQRQTALVAKQAIEVDLLTKGRFRLGVGVGWNEVEYEALDKEFHNRGKRLDEQVEIMRALWNEPVVTFDGTYEKITGAGLAPRPIQRPIPVWFGGRSRAAYERIGRTGDGWFPMTPPGEKLARAKLTIDAAAVAAGRDPKSIGMEGQVPWSADPDKLQRDVQRWHEGGATHVSVNTMAQGFTNVDEHLAALEQAASALGVRQ